MKRYSKEHDEHWFLGISAYQWRAVLFVSLPFFFIGPWYGIGALLVCFALAWTAWL